MIRVFEPRLTLSDKFSVLRSVFRNNISGTSPTVADFESDLADNFERKYAIAVSNAVSGIELIADEIGIKEGDEVSVKVIGFDRGKVKLSIKEVS